MPAVQRPTMEQAPAATPKKSNLPLIYGGIGALVMIGLAFALFSIPQKKIGEPAAAPRRLRSRPHRPHLRPCQRHSRPPCRQLPPPPHLLHGPLPEDSTRRSARPAAARPAATTPATAPAPPPADDRRTTDAQPAGATRAERTRDATAWRPLGAERRANRRGRTDDR